MKSNFSGALIATAIMAMLTISLQAKPVTRLATATIAVSDTGKMVKDKMKMDKMEKKKMSKMSEDKMKMDKMEKKKMSKMKDGKMKKDTAGKM